MGEGRKWGCRGRFWSGWIVVARLGLRTSLTPWDIAALRFGVAGILLLPYVLAKGLALERLGGVGLAAIVLGGAAPVLLANSGLLFASAAHAGEPAHCSTINAYTAVPQSCKYRWLRPAI